MPLRVATFNIRHGVGLDGKLDLARTAAVIRDTGAGLVALQELDRGRDRTGQVDQPATLAEMTGLHVHYLPTVTHPDGEYGIALALDEPGDVDFHRLPQVAEEEPRGAIGARWRGVSAIATHLSIVDRARRLQYRRLVELAAGLAPPVLVVGDLNDPAGRLRDLTRAGFHVPRVPRPTYVGRGRGRRIDHVVMGPGLRFRRSWVTGAGASDHLALVAEIEIA